ncbi:methylated-DNA--[protein]-cysteine S-methyltransferase [Victivallis sp. Marseille-Q1083]|uniref:methylated-DNA--[protein]-cysteine S-methyltransferase n=1 Tax=Victivallis sp. Marseille-Q1083 TaxID=2717288 RepID=UPI0015890016|nr:MGMT family protein [Victivallis sp. Marseille-Q1083]
MRNTPVQYRWTTGKEPKIVEIRLGVVAGTPPPPALAGAGRSLERRLAGELPAWDMAQFALAGVGDWARKVLTLLFALVPAGRVVGYGQLAALAGRPGGARAVGGVMRSNPLPLVYPCHRVVAADGKLNGFMCSSDAAGAALRLKRWLLETEGVEFDAAGRVKKAFFLTDPVDILPE